MTIPRFGISISSTVVTAKGNYKHGCYTQFRTIALTKFVFKITNEHVNVFSLHILVFFSIFSRLKYFFVLFLKLKFNCPHNIRIAVQRRRGYIVYLIRSVWKYVALRESELFLPYMYHVNDEQREKKVSFQLLRCLELYWRWEVRIPFIFYSLVKKTFSR